MTSSLFIASLRPFNFKCNAGGFYKNSLHKAVAEAVHHNGDFLHCASFKGGFNGIGGEIPNLALESD